MEFGWINVFGAGIVILMLIPNLFYAVKYRDSGNLRKSGVMNLLEQVGRYACMLLMWMPLCVWKFGFSSVGVMLLYVVGDGALLLAYFIVWIFYFRERTAGRALALAVLPTLIFLNSGLTLRHWLLAGASILFGAGHIYVTVQNSR